MTDFAKVVIIGHPSKTILDGLEAIRKWDGGKEIYVCIDDDNCIIDSADNLEAAVKTDLQKYVTEKFEIGKKNTFKTGGHDDLFIVRDPNSYDRRGRFRKSRKKNTHLTPPKKKRRK